MAWELVSTVLKELNFEYNGNVQKISPVNPCILVYSSDSVTICANPYSTSTISHGGYDGTADYAAVSAQISGSLDLCVLGSVMANNTTAYIYRNNRNIRMEVTKQEVSGGNTKYTVRGYAYGTRTVFLGDEARDPRTYQNNKIGLVFLRDEATGRFQIWDQLTFVYPGYYAYLYMTCGGTGDSVVKNAVLDSLITGNEYIPPTPSSDPYAEGGTSTTGGAGGSFDDESDEIDVPAVPLLNLSLNHFISTYAPTVTQLNDLADFMWSDWLSQGPTLSKIFADPSDAIISLHMLPFTPATATAVTVTIGSYSTGVSMDPLTLQFYTIDCGELAIAEYWGNYLDYNPYTKLTLFLPYVGEITLNPDEVMGQTIGIKYRVDALTGAFVCFVTRADKKILGEYQGNCALEVPISSANYAQLHSALLGLAGTAVAAGAAGITGGVSSLLNGAPGVIKSAAGVMDSKVRHSHGGSLCSAAGFMGSQKPYLIIERARQCLPDGLNEFAGYPSQVTARLGDQTGFTSVSDIILDGIPLTDGELTELREILKGGIYV